MFLEVFTEVDDESNALYAINHIETKTKKDTLIDNIGDVKKIARNILGDNVVNGVKKIIKK